MAVCTYQSWEERANIIYHNKYDYSKFDYVNMNTKSVIICPFHGKFEKRMKDHLNKNSACVKCSNIKKSEDQRLGVDEIIDRCNKIHNNKYTYKIKNYKNINSYLELNCQVHGTSKQTIKSHLFKKSACLKCRSIIPVSDIIRRCNIVHLNKYQYDISNYIDTNSKINIICPIHGKFSQIVTTHLHMKCGCPKCGYEKNAKNLHILLDEIKKRINKLESAYLYDFSNYIDMQSKINIICNKHGIFKQCMSQHLNQNQGCPICKSSRGELKILNYLKNNNINYIKEKRFKDCKDKKPLPFDFYLIDLNICIEFDGKQHFEESSFFGGKQGLEDTQHRDKIKNKYCLDNNIKLYRISYLKFNKIEEILKEIL